MKQLYTQDINGLISILPRILKKPHMDIFSGQLFLPGNFAQYDCLKRGEFDSLVMLSASCAIDITADVTLHPFCFIGAGATLLTHSHDHSGTIPLLIVEETQPEKFTTRTPKILHPDVWIYPNCMILPRCSFIARGCVIGSCSVVTKPISEEYSIWAGNPARRVGSRLDPSQKPILEGV